MQINIKNETPSYDEMFNKLAFHYNEATKIMNKIIDALKAETCITPEDKSRLDQFSEQLMAMKKNIPI